MAMLAAFAGTQRAGAATAACASERPAICPWLETAQPQRLAPTRKSGNMKHNERARVAPVDLPATPGISLCKLLLGSQIPGLGARKGAPGAAG